jgi:hypothetical protein
LYPLKQNQVLHHHHHWSNIQLKIFSPIKSRSNLNDHYHHLQSVCYIEFLTYHIFFFLSFIFSIKR